MYYPKLQALTPVSSWAKQCVHDTAESKIMCANVPLCCYESAPLLSTINHNHVSKPQVSGAMQAFMQTMILPHPQTLMTSYYMNSGSRANIFPPIKYRHESKHTSQCNSYSQPCPCTPPDTSSSQTRGHVSCQVFKVLSRHHAASECIATPTTWPSCFKLYTAAAGASSTVPASRRKHCPM